MSRVVAPVTNVLTSHLTSYLAVREAMGYSVRAETRLLPDLLGFIQSRWPHESSVIRAEWAVDWAITSPPRGGVSSRAARLSMARRFLTYLRAFLPGTEVPQPGLLASPRRRAPYLYSETEISRILAAARQLGPRHSLRPHTLTTLLGLLASTGLRVSEALNLSVSDIRLSAKPAHLVIRETKFGKSRLVPLHPSAVEPLCEYAYLRKRLGYAALSEAFFVSEQGAALSYSSLEQTFQRLLAQLGIQAQDGKRRPTLHAFRHSFAVARLCAWQAAGVDVRAMLPHLSVYLGHVSPSESYWYLSATPELLVTASRVFAAFVAPGGEER